MTTTNTPPRPAKGGRKDREEMKHYELSFAVWQHGSGWQPHNYGDHYITAETPEEAADEWASNMMATHAPYAKSFVEMTVTDAKTGDTVLTRRYICPM
jgi:hypothetical protein